MTNTNPARPTMDDLIERLQPISLRKAQGVAVVDAKALNEAAARIEAQAAEIERLREALQQFVNGVATGMIASCADETLANVTRRARAALQEPKP